MILSHLMGVETVATGAAVFLKRDYIVLLLRQKKK